MTSELETLRADVADLSAKRLELQRLLAESISREQTLRHAIMQALTVAPGAPMLAHVGLALKSSEVGSSEVSARESDAQADRDAKAYGSHHYSQSHRPARFR